jgi:hypothetical protein
LGGRETGAVSSGTDVIHLGFSFFFFFCFTEV